MNRELDQYEALSSMDRKNLLQDLQRVSLVDVMAPLKEPQSVCPVTRVGLVVPCGLTECQYHVEHEWTLNCSLNFMHQQPREGLTFDQVSLLYKKSTPRVQSIYRNCFKLIQRHYLRDSLWNQGVPRYTFKPGFCVTCQTSLACEDESKALWIDEEFGYCSADCRKQFPPQYFDVERFFQADFYRIVEAGHQLFPFHYLEEILGFQPNALRNRLERLRSRQEKKAA